MLHEIHGTTSTRVHDLSQRQLRSSRGGALELSSTLRYFGGILADLSTDFSDPLRVRPARFGTTARFPPGLWTYGAECRGLERKGLCREEAAGAYWGVDRCSKEALPAADGDDQSSCRKPAHSTSATRAGIKPASPESCWVIRQMARLSASAIRPLTTYATQHGEAPMVTTTTANLYVSEPCLNEQERDTLRHFLGLLLEADEPEAILACLRRLAERKAHDAIAARWLTANQRSAGSGRPSRSSLC